MDQSPRAVLERFYEAEATYMKARQADDIADFSQIRAMLSPDVSCTNRLISPLEVNLRVTLGTNDGPWR